MQMDEETIRKEHKSLELKRWMSTGTCAVSLKVTAKDGVKSRRKQDTVAPHPENDHVVSMAPLLLGSASDW